MVNRSALNGVFLAGLGMLLSALFGIFCAELFMRSQTSNEAVIAYGTAYIRIITIASFGIFGEIIFERLLQSTGRTIYTLVTQGTGAVLNIILTPSSSSACSACRAWRSPVQPWPRCSARSWRLFWP